MTIDDYVAEVEGRIYALTTICATIIACHPDQAAMRSVLADARKIAEEHIDPQLAPYNQGLLAVLADLELAAETRTQADLVKKLHGGQTH